MSLSQEKLEGLAPDQRDAELQRVKDIVAGEQPLMGDVPFAGITLFRGVYVNNNYHQEAEVRELTGTDEEAIARMMSSPSPTQYVNAMVAYGTRSLGPYELDGKGLQERLSVIETLLVGEKEYLFLNILRVTYGDTRTIPVRCITCNEMNDISFSLTDDVPLRKMEDPFRPTYEYVTRSGTNIEYRLVTGADQAEAMRRANLTLPEQNTIMFSRCITTVNGQPLVDPLHFARNLGAFDRRQLLDDMNAKQPGPYFEEVKLPCASCGAESTFTPAWADLLPS